MCDSFKNGTYVPNSLANSSICVLGSNQASFILLAEGTYEYIEPFIKGNEKVVYSSVCDRVDIKEEANVTQYPTSCSHVKSNQYTVVENEGNGGKITRSLTREEVDMKVKLYDYSIETNQTWWEEFSKLANK